MEMDLRPNIFLISLIFFLLLGAFFSILFLDLAIIFKILLSISLVFYGIYAFFRHFLLTHKNSIRKIIWQPGRWDLILGHGEKINAELLEDSILGSQMVILNFKVSSRRICSTIIFHSKTNHEKFRSLIRSIKIAKMAS